MTTIIITALLVLAPLARRAAAQLAARSIERRMARNADAVAASWAAEIAKGA